MAGVPVGEGFLGRIVDALGSPIDDKGDIQADGYRPVECKRLVLQSVSQYQYLWRLDFFLLIQCSL